MDENRLVIEKKLQATCLEAKRADLQQSGQQSWVRHEARCSGVLFNLFGTVVVPFYRASHRDALARAAEALDLDRSTVTRPGTPTTTTG